MRGGSELITLQLYKILIVNLNYELSTTKQSEMIKQIKVYFGLGTLIDCFDWIDNETYGMYILWAYKARPSADKL